MISKILNLSPQTIINLFKQNYLSIFSSASWEKVQKGYLKGMRLFVNTKKSHIFDEMVNQNYDNFLYQDKKDFKNKTIWDIGAHIGFHTLGYAKAVGKSGQVIAFEPNPHNLERLKQNIDANRFKSRITIQPIALGESTKKESMNISADVDSGKSSGGFISTQTPPMDRQIYSSFSSISIQTMSAEQYLIDNPSHAPDILKIDVEGHEANVLIGAKKILRKYKPTLYIEVHHVTAMLNVSKILLPLKYKVEIIDNSDNSLSRCFIKASYEK